MHNVVGQSQSFWFIFHFDLHTYVACVAHVMSWKCAMQFYNTYSPFTMSLTSHGPFWSTYICCVCCTCSQDAVVHLKTVVKIKKTAFGDPSTEVQCLYTTLPRIQREDVCHVTELFHYVDFCHVSLCQPITVRGFSPVAGHNLFVRRRCSKCREAP